MALWKTPQGIKLCCETEFSLEPLQKVNAKQTSCGIKVTSQGIISYCPDKKSLMGPMTKYDQEYMQEYMQELCSFALIQNTNYGLEF